MPAKNTLRRRLIIACVLLAVVIGGVFAAAAYVIVEAVEYELIDARLSRAADQFKESRRMGAPAMPFTDLRIAVDADIPEDLRSLPAGLQEVEQYGRTLKVLIIDDGANRYAVIDDVSDFERVEFISFVSLGVAFFAGVLLALAIARASANRIIAPLIMLAESVQQDNLAVHPQLLNAADETGVLARALEARKAQVDGFLARERSFTADVSHELRTPLTVILGAAELLQRGLEGSGELQAVAERIRRTAVETSARVSALLQLARTREQLVEGPLALRALVQQEIERCRPLLEGKPVTLSFDAPEEVWVHAAPELPAIAVSNLLRNACYATQRGSVSITLRPGALVVEDTGPGIPESVRTRLFEPFVRRQADTSAGSGLGLSIVKRVTEHLGWTIHLQDAPQGGSRFMLGFSPFTGNLTRS